MLIDIVEQLPVNLKVQPQYRTRPLSAVTHLVVHHLAADSTPEATARYHISPRSGVPEGYPGIAYHTWTGFDGRTYQVNYFTTVSYHAGTMAIPNPNTYSIGAALNGHLSKRFPTLEQLAAITELDLFLEVLLGRRLKLVGHGQVPGASTACPGSTAKDWLPHLQDRKYAKETTMFKEMEEEIVRLDNRLREMETKIDQYGRYFIDIDKRRFPHHARVIGLLRESCIQLADSAGLTDLRDILIADRPK